MNGRPRRGLLWLAALAALVPAPADADTVWFAVSEPTALGATDYETTEIIGSAAAGTYALAARVAEDAGIGALHRRADGGWLFAPAAPVAVGVAAFAPRDIVAFDGSSYAVFLCGSDAGIPDGARIDALFLDDAGRTVVSFDVPVELGGTAYGPSDLVLYDGGFALYWGGEAHGVPAGANVVGADLDGTAVVLAFDAPVRLGAIDFEPGTLVAASGSAFAEHTRLSGWPGSGFVADFSFAGGPAPVSARAGDSLTVARLPDGRLQLAWSDDCGGDGDGNDWSVYEGQLGDFASHALVSCTTAGATNFAFDAAGGNRYYLVSARSDTLEGSLGTDSAGSERPAAVVACGRRSIASCSSPAPQARVLEPVPQRRAEDLGWTPVGETRRRAAVRPAPQQASLRTLSAPAAEPAPVAPIAPIAPPETIEVGLTDRDGNTYGWATACLLAPGASRCSEPRSVPFAAPWPAGAREVRLAVAAPGTAVAVYDIRPSAETRRLRVDLALEAAGRVRVRAATGLVDAIGPDGTSMREPLERLGHVAAEPDGLEITGLAAGRWTFVVRDDSGEWTAAADVGADACNDVSRPKDDRAGL